MFFNSSLSVSGKSSDYVAASCIFLEGYCCYLLYGLGAMAFKEKMP
jgi:hypothetical protein